MKAEEAVKAEHDEVTGLGGLYVLGTERHESRRIDNQLRGRSGRQGDPGESRFYLSLQDDLMRLFNAAMVDRFMTTAKMDDNVPIESKLVTRSIQSAQGQVEGRNFEIRKNVLKYDDVLNRQRTVIYDERRRVLEGEDLHEQIRHFVNDVISGYVDAETAEGFSDDWDLDRLWTALKTLYPVSVTPEEVEEAVGGRPALTAENLKEQLLSDAHHAYDAREEQLGAEVMREVERRVVLSVLDRKWREHLYEMDYLQEGIGLRAMAQRDPLVEYQREGFQLSAMMDSIKEESVGYLFNVNVEVEQPATAAPAVQPMSVSDMLAGSGRAGGEAALEPGELPSRPRPSRRPPALTGAAARHEPLIKAKGPSSRCAPRSCTTPRPPPRVGSRSARWSRRARPSPRSSSAGRRRTRPAPAAPARSSRCATGRATDAAGARRSGAGRTTGSGRPCPVCPELALRRSPRVHLGYAARRSAGAVPWVGPPPAGSAGTRSIGGPACPVCRHPSRWVESVSRPGAPRCASGRPPPRAAWPGRAPASRRRRPHWPRPPRRRARRPARRAPRRAGQCWRRAEPTRPRDGRPRHTPRGGPPQDLRRLAGAGHHLDDGLREVRGPVLRVGQVAAAGGLGPNNCSSLAEAKSTARASWMYRGRVSSPGRGSWSLLVSRGGRWRGMGSTRIGLRVVVIVGS